MNLARDPVAVDPAGAVVEVDAEEEVLVLPPPHAVASAATPISGKAIKSPSLLGREPSRCISVTNGVETTDMKRLAEKVKSFLRSPGPEKARSGGWRPP